MKVIVMNESEEFLTESKVVTFEGNPSPKFGWAVVMAGGAGSGKGHVINHRILLPNKTIDVDEMKKQYLKLKISNPEKYKGDNISLKGVDEKTLDKIENHKKLTRDEIEEAINAILSDSENVSELHKIVKSKKWKDKIVDSFLRNADTDKLPNIVFDMTGDEERKLINTANQVKRLGYKTALVWVITNFKVAETRNAQRQRKVSDDILTSTHSGAREAILGFLEKSSATKCYDEIWLVINSPASVSKDLTPEETKLLQKMPCIQLEKRGDKFDFSKETKMFINKFLDLGNEDNTILHYLAGLIDKSRLKRRRQHRRTF